MKTKPFVHSLLVNKNVLLVITVLAVFNLIGFIVVNNMEAAITFVLMGFLTFFFSKNMIIVLSVPLILVNMVQYSKNAYRRNYRREGLTTMEKNKDNNKKKEGLATSTSSSANKKESKDGDKEDATTKSGKDAKKQANAAFLQKGAQQQIRTSQGLPVTPVNFADSTDDATSGIASSESSSALDESFEVGRNKKAYNIDYASTIEDAYDQLNQILGSDGIKRLTTDTQSLMKQQLQLAESMKDMGPMIQGMQPLITQAKEILSENGSGIGNLSELAKKFGLNKKKERG